MTKEQTEAMERAAEEFNNDVWGDEEDRCYIMSFKRGFQAAQTPEMLMLNPLVKGLVEALRTVIDQPFKGSWDAQAVYCQKALAPFKEKKNG